MRLRLSPIAIATAAAFAHRFFAVKSMVRNCRALVAAAALYSAGKVEETPARAREVLAAVDALVPLRRPKEEGAGGGGGGGEEGGGAGREEEEEEEGGRGGGGGGEEQEEEAAEEAGRSSAAAPQPPPPLASDEGAMLSAVDALMTAERALLYALGFRLDVEHPFRTALSLAKEHGDSATAGSGAPSSATAATAAAAAAVAAAATNGDASAAAAAAAAKAQTQPPLPGPGAKKLAQTAWNILTDYLRTRLCLTHRPQAVGAAAFLVALRLHGADVAAPSSLNLASSSSSTSNDQKKPSSSSPPQWWWEGLGVTPAEIGSAADELLKVYEEGGGGGGGEAAEAAR